MNDNGLKDVLFAGAEEFAHPLRDVANAESIRNHLLQNWQAANTPGNLSTWNYTFEQYLLDIFYDRLALHRWPGFITEGSATRGWDR